MPLLALPFVVAAAPCLRIRPSCLLVQRTCRKLCAARFSLRDSLALLSGLLCHRVYESTNNQVTNRLLIGSAEFSSDAHPPYAADLSCCFRAKTPCFTRRPLYASDEHRPREIPCGQLPCLRMASLLVVVLMASNPLAAIKLSWHNL